MAMERKTLIMICLVVIGISVLVAAICISSTGLSTTNYSMGDHSSMDAYNGSVYSVSSDGAVSEIGEALSPNDSVLVGSEWYENHPAQAEALVDEWISSGHAVAAIGPALFERMKGSTPLSFDYDAQILALYVESGISFCLSLSCSEDLAWAKWLSDASWRSTGPLSEVETNYTLSCVATSIFDDGKRPVVKTTDATYLKKGFQMPVSAFTGDGYVQKNADTGILRVSYIEMTSRSHALKTMELRYDMEDGTKVYDDPAVSWEEIMEYEVHTAPNGIASWKCPKGSLRSYDRHQSVNWITDVHSSVLYEFSKKGGDQTVSNGECFIRMDDGPDLIGGSYSVVVEAQSGGMDNVRISMKLETCVPV